MSQTTLVVSADPAFQQTVSRALDAAGIASTEALDGPTAQSLAQQVDPRLIVWRLEAPRTEGFDLLDWTRESIPWVPMILVSDRWQSEDLIEAFRRGACDCVMSARTVDELVLRCRRALSDGGPAPRPLARPNEPLLASDQFGMLGDSAPMREVYRLIESVSPTRCNVLITGESGTGKELVARALHSHGPVKEGPFVALNCAAIAPSLLESELFGHVRGAFTGAVGEKKGYFEAASGGTLFLDEISEMPLSLQPKLLRAIQQKEVYRVGANTPIPVDVRLCAASNRILKQEVAEGRFREDLYFRIRVVDIQLPPLRERRKDVPLLVEHAIRRGNAAMAKTIEGVDPAGLRALLRHRWPGNVRELENVIERAMIVARGQSLKLEDLPPDLRRTEDAEESDDSLRAAVARFERDHIRSVLLETRGNREEAARRLAINPSTLYRKLNELGIREDTRAPRGSIPAEERMAMPPSA